MKTLRQRLGCLSALSALALALALGLAGPFGADSTESSEPTPALPAEPAAPPRSSPAAPPPAPAEAAPEARPARADLAPVQADIDEALKAHGRAAAPRWRRTGGILVHSDQPDLQQLAEDMAARMDEAADGLPAAYRQELMMEERQLLSTLRRRYAGLRPLEAELDALDAGLAELEAIPTTPVASPPPRGSPARPR